MALRLRMWPWWAWAIAAALLVVLALVSAVIGIRVQGRTELQRVITELTDKGLIHLPAQLAERAPAVDDARQEQAYAQQQRIASAAWAGDGYPSSMQRFTTSPPADVKKLQQLVTDSQVERDLWRALIATGPVVLTGYGWLRHDFPHPEDIGILTAMRLRVADGRAARALASSQAAVALLAKDPRPDLADLDALVHALQSGPSLIDAMILGTIGQIRDQAWLEATIRGVDPAPWIAEPSTVFAAVTTGVSAERAWMTGGLYQDVRAGRQIAGSELMGISAGIPSWLGGLHLRSVAAYDVAFAYAWEGRLEERLRGQPVDLSGFTTELSAGEWKHPLSSLMIPNLIESARVALQLDATARRARAAAALIHTWQRTHLIPADITGLLALLPSDLLAAQGDHPAITYQVIAPGRFRLWTDLATSPTDLLPAGRIDAATATTAAWTDKGWWMDVDLNQLPTP